MPLILSFQRSLNGASDLISSMADKEETDKQAKIAEVTSSRFSILYGSLEGGVGLSMGDFLNSHRGNAGGGRRGQIKPGKNLKSSLLPDFDIE